jgi:hypothetical protein
LNDARWIEVDLDVAAAVRHFCQSLALHADGGFAHDTLDGYRAVMALQHALQSAHTSMESALLRILDLLGESRPTGENWHADLIRRASLPIAGQRPAIISEELATQAHETRRFRHRAIHNYDGFDIRRIGDTLSAARFLAEALPQQVKAFRAVIDPT